MALFLWPYSYSPIPMVGCGAETGLRTYSYGPIPMALLATMKDSTVIPMDLLALMKDSSVIPMDLLAYSYDGLFL